MCVNHATANANAANYSIHRADKLQQLLEQLMFERDKMQVDCEKALKDLEIAKQQIGVGGNKSTSRKEGDKVCIYNY
jgi:hypothetical protein